MATPGASPLADLQTTYAMVCAAIRDFYAGKVVDYSIDGVSVNRTAYIESLEKREEALRKIPGVAPSTNPLFTIDEFL